MRKRRVPKSIQAITWPHTLKDVAPKFADDFLLPDESREEFQSCNDAMFAELKPVTPLEIEVFKSVVYTFWAMPRHRRLLSGTLRTAFAEHAAGAFEDGRPGKVLGTLARNKEGPAFVKALMSDDEGARATAEKVLKEKGVTRAEICAAAFMACREAAAYHEWRDDELERVLRSRLDLYDKIRSRRLKTVPADTETEEAA